MGLSSTILTILIPPLGLPLSFIGLHKDFKNWKQYILCLALFLAAVAYSYVPTGNSDLVRYIDNITFFGQMSFGDAVAYQGWTGEGIGSNLITLYAFYWLIGRTGDYHLAPAITTFVIYYIGYYTTCRISEDIELNKKYVVRYIVFITLALNFFGIINNIRNIFAFSIIGFAIFRDYYLKKRDFWTVILYIFPLFFHSSAILFVFLRLLLELPSKLKPICSVALLSSNLMVGILYNNIHRIGTGNIFTKLLSFAIMKGYAFFNDTSSTWGLIVQRSGSQRLARVLYITMAIIFCVTALLTEKRNNSNGQDSILNGDKRIHAMHNFDFYIGLVTIACVSMLMPEYWRFVSPMILFGGVIYMRAYTNSNHRSWKQYVINIVFLLMLPCAALWARDLLRGSEITALLMQPFVSSPILVFFKDLASLIQAI